MRVPNGFAITAEAYRHVLDRSGAWAALRESLAGLDPGDVADLARRAARAREIIFNAPLPDDLTQEILAGYAWLAAQYGPALSVAVRSSATAEDLPQASFAGQHETFLNVRGEGQLLEACRHCFASLFTDRAIRYRIDNGFDHFRVLLSVGVQQMVRADLAASGVMFIPSTKFFRVRDRRDRHQCSRRALGAGAQERRQRRSMAAKAPRLRAAARELPP